MRNLDQTRQHSAETIGQLNRALLNGLRDVRGDEPSFRSLKQQFLDVLNNRPKYLPKAFFEGGNNKAAIAPDSSEKVEIPESISLEQWQQGVSYEVKDLLVQSFVMGGGNHLDPAARSQIQDLVSDRIQGISSVTAALIAGESTVRRFLSRVSSYLRDSELAYHVGEFHVRKATGSRWMRRILQPAEHCVDCISYADSGWQPLGSLPLPKQASRCRNNCKCRVEYSNSQDRPRNDSIDSFLNNTPFDLNGLESVKEKNASIEASEAIAECLAEHIDEYEDLLSFEVGNNITGTFETDSGDIAAFSILDNDRIEWDDLDMIADGWTFDKKPNCKKGKPCGGACIPKSSNCKKGAKGSKKKSKPKVPSKLPNTLKGLKAEAKKLGISKAEVKAFGKLSTKAAWMSALEAKIKGKNPSPQTAKTNSKSTPSNQKKQLPSLPSKPAATLQELQAVFDKSGGFGHLLNTKAFGATAKTVAGLKQEAKNFGYTDDQISLYQAMYGTNKEAMKKVVMQAKKYAFSNMQRKKSLLESEDANNLPDDFKSLKAEAKKLGVSDYAIQKFGGASDPSAFKAAILEKASQASGDVDINVGDLGDNGNSSSGADVTKGVQPTSSKLPPSAAPAAEKFDIQSKPPSIQDGFPPSLDDLEKVKNLGGSTGAQLVRDPTTGKQYVLKRGNSSEHLREEMDGDRAYQAMGVNVPRFQEYRDADGRPVKVAEFIEGETFGKLKGKARKDAIAKIQQDFIADAILGNWDVVGASGDNIIVAKDGTPWRIDNGSAYRFRAQGKTKPFGEHPTELFSMRESRDEFSKVRKEVFGGIGHDNLITQIDEIDGDRKSALLKSAPKALRPTIEKRLSEADRMSEYSKTFRADRYSEKYTSQFAEQNLKIRAAGIMAGTADKLSAGVKTSSVYLADDKGTVFDNFRGKNSASDRFQQYLKSEPGLSDTYTAAYMTAQGGSSWSGVSVATKYQMLKNQEGANRDDYYWGNKGKTPEEGLQLAKKSHAKSLKMYEGNSNAEREQNFSRTIASHHAYTYEMLTSTDLPNVNREKGTIELIRTENNYLVKKIWEMKQGDSQEVKRGIADSYSLVRPTYVHGTELFTQELPLHRVYMNYVQNPGSSHKTGFYSEKENEFVADARGIKTTYLKDYGGSNAGKEDNRTLDEIKKNAGLISNPNPSNAFDPTKLASQAKNTAAVGAKSKSALSDDYSDLFTGVTANQIQTALEKVLST